MRLSIVVGIFASLIATSVRASVISGPITSPENGHTYYLLSQDIWTNSEAEAVSLGGTLAIARNATENNFLTTTFGVNRNLWIGLWDPAMDNATDASHAANFAWVNGDTSTFRNWVGHEPNNTNAHNEWYVLSWGNVQDVTSDSSVRAYGGWADVSNNPGSGLVEPFGVVEVTPEPASIGIAVVAGLLALLTQRRRRTRCTPEHS